MPGGNAFTFEAARRLLPEVRRITAEALSSIAEIQEANAGAGDAEDRSSVEKAVAAILETWAGRVRELGAEVKGPWLVDFDSGAGYYCWRWPEESLDFFHSYEEGFAGRVRIQ